MLQGSAYDLQGAAAFEQHWDAELQHLNS
eukprot:SAG31_NODE_33110_length_347_cov_1.951613_1_plen_28_part_01